MFKILIAAGALAAALIATPVAAQVIERSADHFVLSYEIDLESPPEDIWTALGEIGEVG